MASHSLDWPSSYTGGLSFTGSVWITGISSRRLASLGSATGNPDQASRAAGRVWLCAGWSSISGRPKVRTDWSSYAGPHPDGSLRVSLDGPADQDIYDGPPQAGRAKVAERRLRLSGRIARGGSKSPLRHHCDVSGHRDQMSRDIVRCSGPDGPLVVGARIQGDGSQQLAVFGQYAYVEISDQDGNQVPRESAGRRRGTE